MKGVLQVLVGCTVAAGGCALQRSASLVSSYDPQAAPSVATVQPRKGDPALAAYRELPYCCYAFANATGQLWRVSLDGSVRELVIAYQKPWTVKSHGPLSVQLQGTEGRLLCGPLHGRGAPIAVLDKTAQGRQRIPVSPPGRSDMCMGETQANAWLPASRTTVRYADTGGECPWTLTWTYLLRKLEPNHYHEDLRSVAFARSGVKTKQVGGQPKVLAVFSPGAAVVLTGGSLDLWDLRTDRHYLLARADSAVVWPRDLSEKERFAPFASGAWSHRGETVRWAWKLRSPTDIASKPEYVVSHTQKPGF